MAIGCRQFFSNPVLWRPVTAELTFFLQTFYRLVTILSGRHALMAPETGTATPCSPCHDERSLP
jgi:hypothetical protein